MTAQSAQGKRFAGYAAIFDRPDKGGDIVRKGAFARAATGGVTFAVGNMIDLAASVISSDLRKTRTA